MFFMEVPTIIIPESKKHRGKMWKVRLATCFSISLQDQRPGDITATMLKWGGYPKNHGGQNWRYKILYIIQLLYIIYIYIIHMCVSIWVNYNNSLAWNKAILDDSAFSPWFQWGRSEVVIICPDLCVFIYIYTQAHFGCFGGIPFPLGNVLAWRIQMLYHVVSVGRRCSKNILVGGFNTSEKYESQLGLLFPIYGKTKIVPNHQPGSGVSK